MKQLQQNIQKHARTHTHTSYLNDHKSNMLELHISILLHTIQRLHTKIKAKKLWEKITKNCSKDAQLHNPRMGQGWYEWQDNNLAELLNKSKLVKLTKLHYFQYLNHHCYPLFKNDLNYDFYCWFKSWFKSSI